VTDTRDPEAGRRTVAGRAFARGRFGGGGGEIALFAGVRRSSAASGAARSWVQWEGPRPGPGMHGMTGSGIFNVYRMTLAIVFGSYAVVRTAHFLWHWQSDTRRAGRHEALLRRFLLTSLLRTRLRRFWFDWVQISVLLAVFVYLVSLQSPARDWGLPAGPAGRVGSLDGGLADGQAIR